MIKNIKKLMGHLVLVKEKDENIESNIILVDTNTKIAEVVQVGTGGYIDEKFVECSVKPGDTVVYPSSAKFEEIKIDDIDYKIISEFDIFGVKS